MTLEYLLVAMAVGLVTATAVISAIPEAQRTEKQQLQSLYGPYP